MLVRSCSSNFEVVLTLSSLKGRKVRRILDATDNPVPGGNDWDLKTGWPTPGKDRRLIYLDNCEISQIAISHLRMVSVDCNRLATNGYTAVVDGMHPPRIYAHTSDTPVRFYKGQDGFDDPTGWIYMPIDEGEHLMEIWAVRVPGGGLAALMVRHEICRHLKDLLTLQLPIF